MPAGSRRGKLVLIIHQYEQAEKSFNHDGTRVPILTVIFKNEGIINF
jgi:hypothetical protein